jgi:indole-3-glycerol phosphate synthase
MISKVISIVHRKSSNHKSISLIINIKTNELMKDILSEIIANKRFEVDLQKRAISIEQLQEGISESPTPRSMKQALASSASGIIAEFKRRSPSKGWIKEEVCPKEIVPSYAAAGASALSILTDEKFFGGSLKDIRTARPLVEIPILRKDFIIDAYQLYQARIVGADAILLIAAALEQDKCNELTEKAHSLGLEVLLEIHNTEELSYINKEIDMIGVNNRNLGTFFTDVENSFRLAEQLPQDSVLVSESGISNPEIVKRLRTAGFRGFLIGETLMKTEHPGETLQNFLQAMQ